MVDIVHAEILARKFEEEAIYKFKELIEQNVEALNNAIIEASNNKFRYVKAEVVLAKDWTDSEENYYLMSITNPFRAKGYRISFDTDRREDSKNNSNYIVGLTISW